MKIDILSRSQIIQAAQDAAPPRAVQTDLSTDAAPAAIYHGSENANGGSLLNKSGVRLYAEMLYTTEEWDEYMRSPSSLLAMAGIGQPSGNLRRAYDAALSYLSPELKAKDWSFSVSDGKLVFEAGQDELSTSDVAALRAAFQNAGVESDANAVADVIVSAIETDRYWMYRHLGTGIGSYDVTKENFSDIVNLRMYMEDYREGNRYDPHLVNPTDYAVGYAGGGYEILQQIAAYAKTIDVPRRRVIV